ncbi:MAG: flagellar export chaperone FliS [Pseudomonadota bacterium]
MFVATPMSKHAKAYGQMAVNTRVSTTDPHGLIEMLFDAIDEQLAIALGALDAGDAERRGQAIRKAVLLLQDGLRGGLDLEKGGELAQRLDALYEYSVARLVEAHTRRDRAAMQEVREHLRTVADGWKAIRPQ